MNKLIVAGCSFSDRFYVEKSYGDYLSEKLNMHYVHEARSCGSNSAIWRIITNKIINNEITPDDIVLIQYTEANRTEFCSYTNPKATPNVHEKYDNDSYLIRYKVGSEDWHHDRKIGKFLNIYTNNMLHTPYELDKFKTNDYNFRCMLEKNKINVYFISVSLYSPEFHMISNRSMVDNYFSNRTFAEPDKYREHPYCFSDDDRFHLSADGHKAIADDLYKFLKDRNGNI